VSDPGPGGQSRRGFLFFGAKSYAKQIDLHNFQCNGDNGPCVRPNEFASNTNDAMSIVSKEVNPSITEDTT
jgi:hypothetical protein